MMGNPYAERETDRQSDRPTDQSFWERSIYKKIYQKSTEIVFAAQNQPFLS